MAKKKLDVNKSAQIRKLLEANPKISAQEAITVLGEKGIKIASSLFYYTKGKIRGRKGRRRKAQKVAAQITTVTSSANGDAVKTILKVKEWAAEVGGMKKLRSLVDALSE